jgi:hypothetical protein
MLVDPANRLGYVTALAWPVTLIVIALRLSDVIRERVGSMTKVNALGLVDAEFAERTDSVLQSDLRRSASVLIDEPPPAKSLSAPGDHRAAHEHPNGRAELGQTESAEAVVVSERVDDHRREAVERAVRAGAAWGYAMADQYAAPPAPIIEWDDAGEPKIKGARGIRRASPFDGVRRFTQAFTDPAEEIRSRAEDEVRRLERDFYRLSQTTNIIDQFATREQLDAARARLAKVDPRSPLLL